MPKGVHERNTDDVLRLGMDIKTYHYWDQVSFNDAKRPVANCGAELFPRSLKFVDRENNNGNACSKCGVIRLSNPKEKTWKRWTKEEDTFLEKNFHVLTWEELSEYLGHSVDAIRARYYGKHYHK